MDANQINIEQTKPTFERKNTSVRSINYELRFEIGSRRLLTMRRKVQAQALSFRAIIGEGSVMHELAEPVRPGLLLRSMPESMKDTVQGLLTASLNHRQKWLVYEVSRFPRYYIDLRGNFSDYLTKFSSKTRSTLRRKVGRLAPPGGQEPCWSVYRTPQELEKFLPQALDVSRHTYQERLLNAGLPASASYRQKVLELAAADAVRAYLLFHEGRAIAYLFCPIADGVVEYAYLGFLPEYAGLSPGTVLQWLALRDLFAEGRFYTFDFTEGEGDHKRLFATSHINCCNLLILPSNFRNWIAIRIHRMFNDGVRKLRVISGAVGIQAKIRSWLRS